MTTPDLPTKRKPASLRAAYEDSSKLFEMLRRWYDDIGPSCTFDLSSVDAPDPGLHDRGAVMAFALRKLQALRALSAPDTRARARALIAVVAELDEVIDQVLLEQEGLRSASECAEVSAAHRRLGQVLVDVIAVAGADDALLS